MNKKIVLLVAVLLIVAVIFVACKGRDDVEEPTESTTESTSSRLELHDVSDELDSGIIPDIYMEDDAWGEGDIAIGGNSGEQSGEDSIDWNEIS